MVETGSKNELSNHETFPFAKILRISAKFFQENVEFEWGFSLYLKASKILHSANFFSRIFIIFAKMFTPFFAKKKLRNYPFSRKLRCEILHEKWYISCENGPLSRKAIGYWQRLHIWFLSWLFHNENLLGFSSDTYNPFVAKAGITWGK